jgi:hypothetical protein
VYRFFWQLEERIEVFEEAFSEWAVAVFKVLQPDERVTLNTDGKHLGGTKRQGKGERAVLLVSAFLAELGLTLCQQRSLGDEAKTARALITHFDTLLPDIAWCLTGDAALTEKPVVKDVLKKGVPITSRSRKTRVTS